MFLLIGYLIEQNAGLKKKSRTVKQVLLFVKIYSSCREKRIEERKQMVPHKHLFTKKNSTLPARVTASPYKAGIS
jgi:hypothetical protein